MSFLSYLINGISLGSIYAIIALGYTMVYGIAKMLNFAHGDVIMIGGYVVFVSVSNLGINPYVANVELRYALSVDMADGCRYYNVTEYYYIRYTAERMYLLDYERDMDSYFEPEAASYTLSLIHI